MRTARPVAGSPGGQPRPDEEHHARARPLAVDARPAARRTPSRPRSRSPVRPAPSDHVGVVAFGHTAVALTRGSSSPAEARDQLAGMTVDTQGRHRALRRDRRSRRTVSARTTGRAARSSSSPTATTSRACTRSTTPSRRRTRRTPRSTRSASPARLHARHAARSLQPRPAARTARRPSSAQLAATYAGLRDELARTWQLSYLTVVAARANVSRLTATVAGSRQPRYDATLAFEPAQPRTPRRG